MKKHYENKLRTARRRLTKLRIKNAELIGLLLKHKIMTYDRDALIKSMPPRLRRKEINRLKHTPVRYRPAMETR